VRDCFYIIHGIFLHINMTASHTVSKYTVKGCYRCIDVSVRTMVGVRCVGRRAVRRE
jgi:hypothetical protein